MEIKILAIGDVVGGPGRQAVREIVPRLVRERGVDFVLANGENAAGGSGLTAPLFRDLLAAGVNAVTLGDHVYRRKEVIPLLQQEASLVRPANLPAGAAGRTWTVVAGRSGIKVAVTDMHDPYTSVLKKALPKAALVYDHFHASKVVHDALDEIRRRIQLQLPPAGRRILPGPPQPP